MFHRPCSLTPSLLALANKRWSAAFKDRGETNVCTWIGKSSVKMRPPVSDVIIIPMTIRVQMYDLVNELMRTLHRRMNCNRPTPFPSLFSLPLTLGPGFREICLIRYCCTRLFARAAPAGFANRFKITFAATALRDTWHADSLPKIVANMGKSGTVRPSNVDISNVDARLGFVSRWNEKRTNRFVVSLALTRLTILFQAHNVTQ